MDYKQLLKLEGPNQNGTYRVCAYNGVFIGEFLVKEDGYYDWWPEHPSQGGFWPAYMLHALATALDDLNKDWDDALRKEAESWHGT